MTGAPGPNARRDAEEAYPALALVVGDRWIGAEERPTVPVVDPGTERVLGHLPVADEADLDRAPSRPRTTPSRAGATRRPSGAAASSAPPPAGCGHTGATGPG